MTEEVVTRKNKGLTRFLGFTQTPEYKMFLKDVESKKNEELKKVVEAIKSNETKPMYPNQKINDFDKNLLGDLITLQELYLRNVLATKIPESLYKKSPIFADLPDDITRMIIPLNMRIMRYKRLFDIFFQAATIKEKEKHIDWLKPNFANYSTDKWLNFELQSVKELREKWRLPTKDQLETLINNSMDTRICLTFILQLNHFSKGNEINISTSYTPTENGDILLSTYWYLNKAGKICKRGEDTDATDFILSGIKITEISTINSQNTEKKMGVLEKKKDSMNDIQNFFSDRNPFGSQEQLPKEGINWPLIWKKEEEILVGSRFEFIFIKKTATSSGFIYGKYGKQTNRLFDKSLLKAIGGTRKRYVSNPSARMSQKKR